jgi:hypothetical protein
MKSGNLNFLEPSGPLQACNGLLYLLLVCFLSLLEYWLVMCWVERRITLLTMTMAICCLSHRRRKHLQDTKQVLHFMILCLPVAIFMWIRVSPLFHVSELLFVLALSDKRLEFQLSFQYIQMLSVIYACTHTHGYEKRPFYVCITNYSYYLSSTSLF